ncbi:SusC/RagA family TonB-linked outer membrane protein [Ornithobacterium rhinotracheale]|uniref:SusC/RagA family TonB-linked outer membrane protein n=1 Tax=Ornithobacterium rhinotracheale TaxID=28251 RepID=UPI001FF6E39F|nr:SusC/RagA family TonB-linked outer membrane protein [Ornithobacterium rhinotracheale]MCK0204519.1 SusC/RagA family TonB-linked outer membrane protein [Ornithobacterium rhinotracheale]
MRSKNLWIFIFSLFLCSYAFAQEKVITGKVVDASGYPLADAYVYVEGADKGVYTDAEGNYKISAAVGDKLKFEFIGFDTATKTITAKSKKLDVQLKSGDKDVKLDEVVTTGITKTDKRLFTGAADKLKGDEVKLAGVPDVSRGLEGRSAGVSVQNVSGTFGAAPKIRVRGATSIYGSSKPLWVVDGVILENPVDVDADDLSSGDPKTLISSAVAGLNPDDIESFQILKDGSATSIYGARAMAGVIVITTKKGRAGVSSFNYTGEFTNRLIPSYRNFNIMNSQEQMDVYQEIDRAGWLNFADLSGARTTGIYGKMYQDLYKFDPVTGVFAFRNGAEAKLEYLRAAERRNTDWFKKLFNNNLVQNHSVSISSGSEKSTYYASLSAMFDPGWTKSSNVNRYTGNFNASYKILDNLKLNIISNGSYRKQKAPGSLSQSLDVVSGKVSRDFDINPYSYALNTSRALDADVFYTRDLAPFNILNELENNYIDLNVSNLKFQGGLTWDIMKGLTANVLGAVSYNSVKTEHHVTEFSNRAMAYRVDFPTTKRDRNPFLYNDPDERFGYGKVVLPEGGLYRLGENELLSYDFRGTLQYNTRIKDVHTLNTFLGAESTSAERHSTWNQGYGMQYSMGEVPFFDYRIFKKLKEEGGSYYGIGNTLARSLAFFGNATYSYKGKYTLNGTLRYEGSNQLGKSKNARWLPTWNISGLWAAHEEDFFTSLRPIISTLRLKTSYSLTADRGPASNSAVVIRSITPWRHSADNQEGALVISSLENSDLTYEKKTELNIGAELGFLDNRINLNVDWYKRLNYDLIATIDVQGIGGEVRKWGNVAEMKSNGLEVSLSTLNLKTTDFSWSTSFIYSHINNEVTKLANVARMITLVSGSGFTREGYPVRGLFSIPFKGSNDVGLPTFLNRDKEITVSDINFQESQLLDYLQYSGSVDPTDLGSFGNIFKYKGFNLNVFLTYSFGNVVRLDPVFSNVYSELDAMPRDFRNRWVLPGDEKITNIPVISARRPNNLDPRLSVAYNAYNYSTARIAKGDFIRMKEISFGYDFQKPLLEKLKLKTLSLRLQGTNLFLLYADKKLNGQDPEFFNAGGVAVPMPKQFTFTVRVGL